MCPVVPVVPVAGVLEVPVGYGFRNDDDDDDTPGFVDSPEGNLEILMEIAETTASFALGRVLVPSISTTSLSCE